MVLYTTRAAAEELGFANGLSLRYHAKLGRLRAIRTTEGQWLFHPRELERFRKYLLKTRTEGAYRRSKRLRIMREDREATKAVRKEAAVAK